MVDESHVPSRGRHRRKTRRIEVTTTFRASRETRKRSIFVQFSQLGDKVRARQVPLEPPKFLPIAIEDDERGESIHIILACELQVLLLQFSGLRLRPRTTRPREVELQEHQILVGIIFEISLGQNILVQSNAPAAPVGTGKVKQQQFVAGFGLLLRFVVIVEPTGRGGAASRRMEQKAGCNSKENETTLFHMVTFN